MPKRLTDIAIRNMKPGPRSRDVPDGGCNGLYLILQPSGHRAFAVRYRIDNRQFKMTLGAYPKLPLAEARKLAITAREEAAQGVNPSAAAKAKRIAADAAKLDTVVAVCEKCLDLKGPKLRTADQQRAILRRLVYSTPLGSMPIESVKRSDVVRLLDRIEAQNGACTADTVLAMLRRTFHWHELRSDEFRSPIVRGMGRYDAKAARGHRILTDDELRSVWQATEDHATVPYSALVRLLLLTAARRNEIAGMTWREIEDGIWTLPAERSKNKSEIVRPLSKAAMAIIDERPRIQDAPWLLTTTHLGPITGFSMPMAALLEKSGTSGWHLHDLRRTARSLMSRAKVNQDVAERGLGHALPTIRSIYDKHDFVEEMRDALGGVGSLVERIVEPPAGDVVVPMRR